MIFYEKGHFGESNSFDYFFSENLCYGSHLHRSYEFICVMEGSISIRINDKSYELSKNDVAIMLAYDIHSYITNSNAKTLILIISPELVNTFSQLICSKSPECPVFHCNNEDFSYIIHTLDKMQKDEVLSTKAYLYKIVSIAYNNIAFKENKNNDKTLLHHLLIYVQENFLNNISLKQIASKLGYDYYYLSRYFNKNIGVSFKQLLNDYKINYATQELKATNILISEIAFNCGFESVRSFNRSFKKIMNATPIDYRKSFIR